MVYHKEHSCKRFLSLWLLKMESLCAYRIPNRHVNSPCWCYCCEILTSEMPPLTRGGQQWETDLGEWTVIKPSLNPKAELAAEGFLFISMTYQYHQCWLNGSFNTRPLVGSEKAEDPGRKVVLQRHINPLIKAAQFICGFPAVTQEGCPSVCCTAVSLFHCE